MAEQLQYQRKFNEWKAQQKAKEAAASEAPKDDGQFKELTKQELSRMNMQEQLAYQKKFNQWKADQKKAAAEAEQLKQSTMS